MALKMTDLPAHTQMVKNILYTWHSANADDMSEGMSWYADAFNECVNLSKKHQISITTAAALVSVISPSIMWGGNITAPDQIIDLWKRGVPVEDWSGFNIYPANLRKAVDILNGDLTVVRGQKVEAFMLNILGSKEPVTIDRWALRVALDDPKLPQDKITPSGKKVYRAVADAYHEAANLLGQVTMDVQAVTWTVYRNKYNGRVKNEKAKLAEREPIVA